MNRHVRYVLVGALLLAMSSLSATAQEENPEDIRAEIDKAHDRASRRSETGAVDAAPQIDEVSIKAEKDKSIAKIAVSRAFCLGRLSAALSTPVNQKDDVTQLFTLDGPAEDVKLDLAWTRQSFRLRRFSKVDLLELATRRIQICNKFKIPPGPRCSDTELEKAMKAQGKSSSDIALALKDFFSVKVGATTMSVLRAIPYHDFLLAGSVGRTERKFFNLPGVEQEDDRPSYSLSAAYRSVFESSRISVSLSTQRKFKEAEKARKCSVVEDSTLERCKDLPLGEASMVDSVPLTLEYRIWRGAFAVSPKLIYDFKRSVAAASLPIYLFADSTGKLTGGFRVDWEEHERPVASVFVASPLGLD